MKSLGNGWKKAQELQRNRLAVEQLQLRMEAQEEFVRELIEREQKLQKQYYSVPPDVCFFENRLQPITKSPMVEPMVIDQNKRNS